ncbi:MAG: prolipoprotein diacylglyceryl transferase, partial [Clostridiales bacterium]|nr:prolipoprotein diacylglyceryl transferase [Clostridiales bacterium]
FFLLWLRDRCYSRGQGFVLQWYLIWYGLVRVVIEGLRTDSLMLGSLRISQVVSLLMIVISGTILMLRLKRTPVYIVSLVIWMALFALIAVGVVRGVVVTYLALAAFAVMVLCLFMRETSRRQIT